MSKDATRIPDSEQIPTAEYLRRKRKADYEKAKAARKQQKIADKAKLKAEKEAARAAHDLELWQSLMLGSDLDCEPPS